MLIPVVAYNNPTSAVAHNNPTSAVAHNNLTSNLGGTECHNSEHPRPCCSITCTAQRHTTASPKCHPPQHNASKPHIGALFSEGQLCLANGFLFAQVGQS